MIKTIYWKKKLITSLLFATLRCWLQAQMNMNPYFTAINYPLEKHSLMLMAMSDFQSARIGLAYMLGPSKAGAMKITRYTSLAPAL